MLTYDNPGFLKFCFVFFFIGSILNLYFGLYTSDREHIVNGILLGIVSIGLWQVKKLVALRLKMSTLTR